MPADSRLGELSGFSCLARQGCLPVPVGEGWERLRQEAS